MSYHRLLLHSLKGEIEKIDPPVSKELATVIDERCAGFFAAAMDAENDVSRAIVSAIRSSYLQGFADRHAAKVPA